PSGCRHKSQQELLFLTRSFPSPPLSSRRPNAHCSGPSPVSDRTIGSIFSFTTPFDPTTLVTPALRQKSGQPSGQVLLRPACACRRMNCSPGSAPPTRLLKTCNSKMMPELPLSRTRAGKAGRRHVFPYKLAAVLLVEGPHRTQTFRPN